MAAPIFTFPILQAFDDEGVPLEFAELTFFDSNTTDPADVFSDVDLMNPIAQPIVADNAGRFNTPGVIYLQNDYSYRVRLEDKNGAEIFDVNDIDTPATLTFNLGGNFVTYNGAIYPARFVNVQTGTSYTIDQTDWGKLIILNNPNPVTVTATAPGSGDFQDGWYCSLMNIGAGTVTLQSTANLNNSASDITLYQGQGGGLASDGTDYWSDNWAEDPRVIYSQGATLTISSGAITVTSNKHQVETEGGAGTDDLTTINGMVNGQRLVLTLVNAAHNVVIKTTGGNIINPRGIDITLDTLNDFAEFEYDSTLSKAVLVGYGVANLPVFSNTFTNTQALAYNTLRTVAHGFGAAPKLLQFEAINTTTEGGWAVNDAIYVHPGSAPAAGGGVNGGFQAYSDATNIYYDFPSALIYFQKNTTSVFSATAANWSIRVTAYY